MFSIGLRGLFFLIVGIWFGYGKGVKNHIYFDAPAKIAVLNSYLESGTSVNYLETEIKFQAGLLETMENEVTPFLLKHPIHEGMEKIYQEYRPQIEVLPRVIKARNELNKIIQEINEMDGTK